MPNPTPDYPNAIYVPEDFGSFAGSKALGASDPTLTEAVGQQGEEIRQIQTALGTNPSLIGASFTFQGAWVTATAYEENDFVRHNGNTYLCTADHTSGATSEPGIGATWEDFWQLTFESPELNQSAVIASVTGAATIPIPLNPTTAVHIKSVHAHVVGSGSPSVTFNVNHGGTDLWSSDEVASGVVPTALSTTFNDATVAAAEAVVIDISAKNGTVSYFIVTITYTED